MNLRILILSSFCCLIFSCKSNFVGKKLNYSPDKGSIFEMVFVNDSILEVSSKNKKEYSEKVIYEYDILEKETLEKMRKNEPTVNFRTEKLYGQSYQDIAIKLVSGQNIYLKETDTLNYVKMRIDGKMTERIYFDGGNRYIEL